LPQSCGIELTIRDTRALRLILIFKFDAPLVRQVTFWAAF